MKKASFSQRFCAYIIDILLVAIISSLLTAVIPQKEGVDKLYDEQTEILEKFTKQELNEKQYISQMLDIGYDISRKTALDTIVTIFITILYFCVFPFYHGGQTLGKRAMLIKIEKQDKSKLTMNDLVIRSSLINSIFLNILTTALVLIASKDVYIWGSNILDGIQYLFIMISVMLVAFSKDKNGLHDKLVKTEVVKVDTRVKELEESKCES